MLSRDEIITKVVKVLRLARAAGTEAEAHTALTLAASTALVVVPDAEVLAQASSFANGGNATGGGLPTSDPRALQDGLESGYLHGSGTRLLRGS